MPDNNLKKIITNYAYVSKNIFNRLSVESINQITILLTLPFIANSLGINSFAIVSETEHNIDAETTNTEFGLTAEKNGLTLSLLPNYDWDKEEINNIELGISYDVEVTKSFSIVPYGEYHVDNSFNEKSKIIGLRTAFKF